jgi:DNA-binding transcriptional LysR family regulator
MSQPAISQAVRELESNLGVRLFHRIGRSVSLTSAGEALLPLARQALRDLALARIAASQTADLATGRLDLACLPTLAVGPLAPIVGRFRVQYPGLTITLSDPQDTAELLGFVRSGKCELGLVGTVDVVDLETIPIGEQDFMVVLPPGSPVSDPMPLRELGALPLVAPPRGSSTRGVLDDVLEAWGGTSNVVVETAQREALLPLIAAGAGTGLLPRPLAGIARMLGCVVVEPFPRVARPVAIVHRMAVLTPAAQAFIELAREG